MSEQTIAAVIIGTLLTVAGWLIRDWKNNWQNRIVAQDKRLDVHDTKHTEHDLNHAVLAANLENIITATSETRTDVKELLRQNGKRSTG